MACGTLQTCKHCAKSKAKQKNVRKESVAQKSDVLGHRLCLELSKTTVKSMENATILEVILCEATDKKWSDFTVTKSYMLEWTWEHMHKL